MFCNIMASCIYIIYICIDLFIYLYIYIVACGGRGGGGVSDSYVQYILALVVPSLRLSIYSR